MKQLRTVARMHVQHLAAYAAQRDCVLDMANCAMQTRNMESTTKYMFTLSKGTGALGGALLVSGLQGSVRLVNV